MYEYDADAAKKSESSRIESTGKYKGVFTQAYKLDTNANGTDGIQLSFKADDGRTCELRLYTIKQGKKLMGYNMLMAMMGCIGLKTIAEASAQVNKWDNDAKKIIPVSAITYPELQNKKIGLLLQVQEYQNNSTGKIASSLHIVSVFRHADELTATEIQEGSTKSVSLQRRLEGLKDKLLSAPSATSSPYAPTQAPAEPDFDDDIHFN